MYTKIVKIWIWIRGCFEISRCLPPQLNIFRTMVVDMYCLLRRKSASCPPIGTMIAMTRCGRAETKPTWNKPSKVYNRSTGWISSDKENHQLSFMSSPPPPPPLECIRGRRMQVPIFSGKGIFFGRSLGKIYREKQEKGCFCNCQRQPIPEIGGYILGYPFPRMSSRLTG